MDKRLKDLDLGEEESEFLSCFWDKVCVAPEAFQGSDG